MAKIFIVEDELLIVEDLKQKLRRLGHTVVGHATSGEVAVSQATEARPDLILMDVRLRGKMNGLEAAARIREVLPVPIVFVTAQASAVAAHANHQHRQSVLMKPYSMAALKAVVAGASGEGPNPISGES
jgi:CheY-like chemotaxis protein